MKISAKTDYACKALIALVMHWPNKTPLQLHAIAKDQKIPMKFLTQIMLALKQFGYVQSVRGKSGGYLLQQAPSKIKLGNVVRDLEDSGGNGAQKLTDQAHVMDIVWKDIEKKNYETMEEIDFEAIANRYKSRKNIVMFHI
jgi:Rrf2 family transcriptional regulator, cysteine metabolism repressor